jgi:hypothetical protein
VNQVRAFGRFWWNFVVGDDWRVAVLIALAIGATAALAHVGGVDAWWLIPLSVAVALGESLWRATRKSPS